jgi:hypothetical protein
MVSDYMFLSNIVTGVLDIWDITGNQVAGGNQLSNNFQSPVEGFGSFGSVPGQTDMLARTASGALEVYDDVNGNTPFSPPLIVANTTWENEVDDINNIGASPGIVNVLLRDTSTGNFTVDQVGNNKVLSSAPLNLNLGLDSEVVGAGTFAGNPNEADILTRNDASGAFEVHDVVGGTVSNPVSMGVVGEEWKVAGFGDFSGNPNETDMIMRATANGGVEAGALEVYDISNNQITFAASLGQVGLEWTVAGFGDFSGNPNETDMLMQNTNTGGFEVFDISHNQITGAVALTGQIGNAWQSVGTDTVGQAHLTLPMHS